MGLLIAGVSALLSGHPMQAIPTILIAIFLEMVWKI